MITILSPEGLNFDVAKSLLASRGWELRTLRSFFGEQELSAEALRSKLREIRQGPGKVALVGVLKDFLEFNVPCDMFVRPASGYAYQAMLVADGKRELAASLNAIEWSDVLTAQARDGRPFATQLISHPDTLATGVVKAVQKYFGVTHAAMIEVAVNYNNLV